MVQNTFKNHHGEFLWPSKNANRKISGNNPTSGKKCFLASLEHVLFPQISFPNFSIFLFRPTLFRYWRIHLEKNGRMFGSLFAFKKRCLFAALPIPGPKSHLPGFPTWNKVCSIARGSGPNFPGGQQPHDGDNSLGAAKPFWGMGSSANSLPKCLPPPSPTSPASKKFVVVCNQITHLLRGQVVSCMLRKGCWGTMKKNDQCHTG